MVDDRFDFIESFEDFTRQVSKATDSAKRKTYGKKRKKKVAFWSCSYCNFPNLIRSQDKRGIVFFCPRCMREYRV